MVWYNTENSHAFFNTCLLVRRASVYGSKYFYTAPVQVEVEKKDSDEEPMEMVVEKMVDEPEPEAEADPEEKHVGPILADKMAEDLKPMDTDKESLAESKSPEESIQEDSGSDIAPMQTDDQLKQVQQAFVSFFFPFYICNWKQKPIRSPYKVTLLHYCWFVSSGCICAWARREAPVHSTAPHT